MNGVGGRVIFFVEELNSQGHLCPQLRPPKEFALHQSFHLPFLKKSGVKKSTAFALLNKLSIFM